ncbi:MAG: putative zinc-binding metallopeptidase [Armatimonadetes bacterium]|nr:putative zinc-binding metallopeptidase [Armatimonadota bacterium]
MQLFTCPHCDQRLYFENTSCLGCGRELGFLPDSLRLVPLEPAGQGSYLAAGELRRKCSNYAEHGVCNWLIPAGELTGLCRACRLTEVIPDLSSEENKRQWGLLEAAKRRLLHSLLQLQLPVFNRREDPERGLAFRFLAPVEGEEILTGHADGVITIRLDEADSVQREQARVALHEPYRTVLGHLRHETGHYYWDRLLARSRWLEPFRALFGNEREDYAAALERHYHGPRAEWQQEFISSYASSHPWEDWAECFAHYLHITDTLQTARAFGMCRVYGSGFEERIKAWCEVTEAVNELNRSMGMPDLYPFVLSARVLEKLRFMHRWIRETADAGSYLKIQSCS